MGKYIYLFLFPLISLLVQSCSVVPSYNCKVEITNEHVESSCGFVNGVRFEQINVLKKDSSDLPIIYIVLKSFHCYNSDQLKKAPYKIYFTKENGSYVWIVDTSTNGLYVVNGAWRDKLDNHLTNFDSVIKKKHLDNQQAIDKYNNGSKQFSSDPIIKAQSICPESFIPNTWYFVDFRDHRYAAYLYVDGKMNFSTFKILKPTNI